MKQFLSVLILTLSLGLSDKAHAISSSLISQEFEVGVAAAVSQQMQSYKKMNDIMSEIKSGNRNDALFWSQMQAKYGHEPMPKISQAGSILILKYGQDATQIELISSLERVYFINEISIQINPTESLQDLVAHLQRVFKSRSAKVTWYDRLWRLFLGFSAEAKVQNFDHTPLVDAKAEHFAVLVAALEKYIPSAASGQLQKNHPAVGELNAKIKSTVGLRTPYEVSCRPRMVVVDDKDIGEKFGKSLSQCCADEGLSCAFTLNAINVAENPHSHLENSSSPRSFDGAREMGSGALTGLQ